MCVHGIGGFHLVFEELCATLNEAGFATLMFDLCGRGRSRASPTGEYDADAHLAQMERLLEHVGVMRLRAPLDVAARSSALAVACGESGAVDELGSELHEVPIALVGHSVRDKRRASFL